MCFLTLSQPRGSCSSLLLYISEVPMRVCVCVCVCVSVCVCMRALWWIVVGKQPIPLVKIVPIAAACVCHMMCVCVCLSTELGMLSFKPLGLSRAACPCICGTRQVNEAI